MTDTFEKETDNPRSATCCFTGHRTMSYEEKNKASADIRVTVRALVKKGVRHFITGGALGFDTVAAATVINMRDNDRLTDGNGKEADITLTVAVPCPTQSSQWSFANKTMYNSILKSADEVVLISEKYTSDCMFKRNRYMVDNSAYCICYVTQNSGGSYYTMNYAKSSGLGIINLATDKVNEI
ncbi:MAG: DUF1273 domain-containing protein [Ruminococcaceae bacterium]|nr:DUF1273 domain-containing protein [Oscillospiraceae bacterium]